MLTGAVLAQEGGQDCARRHQVCVWRGGEHLTYPLIEKVAQAAGAGGTMHER